MGSMDKAKGSMAAASDSVKAITAAMRPHPEDAALQRNGCRALRELAGTKELSVRIEAADGITRVLAALHCHPDDMEVQT